MKIRLPPFNINLLVLLLAVLAVSCKSPEERKKAKEMSTFRVFLATGGSQNSGNVTVYRRSPIRLNVEREPLLTEADLESASLMDVPGGFSIAAQFNGHGALVLEGATVAHKGQHLAIQSHFGETRWLAAPVITKRISNGDLVFTPDATREEAERIVRGLTNMVKKIKKAENGF